MKYVYFLLFYLHFNLFKNFYHQFELASLE